MLSGGDTLPRLLKKEVRFEWRLYFRGRTKISMDIARFWHAFESSTLLCVHVISGELVSTGGGGGWGGGGGGVVLRLFCMGANCCLMTRVACIQCYDLIYTRCTSFYCSRNSVFLSVFMQQVTLCRIITLWLKYDSVDCVFTIFARYFISL